MLPMQCVTLWCQCNKDLSLAQYKVKNLNTSFTEIIVFIFTSIYF